jgi:hypothetical protein
MSLLPPDLMGRWVLERVIRDELAQTTLRMSGTAEFVSVAPDSIDWVETGLLHLPTGPIPVTATRQLRRDALGKWTTDFADGREFHPWEVGTDLTHDCAPDIYRGRFDPAPAQGADAWTMRWAARGPAKDYVIDSVYTRASA